MSTSLSGASVVFLTADEGGDGRTMTSWPSLPTDLVNAGAEWVDREVVVCDAGPSTIVSSRNPDDLPAFVDRMLAAFRGRAGGRVAVVRVVVTGATGNVGTSVLRALNAVDDVEEIVGVARRVPTLSVPRVRWLSADVGCDDLHSIMRGSDAVIHLAWVIRPARRPEMLRRVNLVGTARVLRAAADEKVPVVVCASSVGTYAPGPQSHRVDETWPATGVITCEYSRQKATVERMLDAFERDHPATRVVRFRKALIFKADAGSEIARYFLGPFVPRKLVRPSLVPAVPSVSVQVVHSDDVAAAYRAALLSDVRGAFNLAAEPAFDGPALGRLLGARPVEVRATTVRRAAGALYALRLQPTPPGWVDMLYQVPLMSTRRAEDELGWSARTPSGDAVEEIMRGIRTGAGLPTPPLEPAARTELRARGARR